MFPTRVRFGYYFNHTISVAPQFPLIKGRAFLQFLRLHLHLFRAVFGRGFCQCDDSLSNSPEPMNFTKPPRRGSIVVISTSPDLPSSNCIKYRSVISSHCPRWRLKVPCHLVSAERESKVSVSHTSMLRKRGLLLSSLRAMLARNLFTPFTSVLLLSFHAPDNLIAPSMNLIRCRFRGLVERFPIGTRRPSR